MAINIEERDLKHGVLGLVIALLEIIKEALKHQAVRRMEGGSLTDEEIERLGGALMDLDAAVEQLKTEQGVAESVKAVRDGLDQIVNEVIESFLAPGEWLVAKEGRSPGQHLGDRQPETREQTLEPLVLAKAGIVDADATSHVILA